jgi:hypothetical protein
VLTSVSWLGGRDGRLPLLVVTQSERREA